MLSSYSQTMSFSKRASQSSLSKGTSLNPNASEFVPFSLRPSTGTRNVLRTATNFPTSAFSGKQVLDRSESSISTSSEEEARQYWQQQLPDDITPDFKLTGEDEPHGVDKMGHPVSVYGEDRSSTSFLQRTNMPWEMQHLTPNYVATETALIENNNLYPVQFLASQFPGFATESLVEVFFANGCDINLTIEMLIQLELQGDGAFNQNMNSKTLSTPNLTSMDFPALPVPDNKTNLRKYTGDELQQNVNTFGSSEKDNVLLFRTGSLSAKGVSDFASAVRKLSSQDSSLWKYDRSSADVAVGSSRSSNTLSGSYHAASGRSTYSDRMLGRRSAQAAPVWLETGDAVGNLYSEVRGEARDHARIRNMYFEQARNAYVMGNKALAKELSVKGQLHNMQMKAAHSKGQESIYCQRNSISPDQQGDGRCQEKMIDLHGLHVSEAIHVLKQELSMLRNTARLAEQQLHVYICVGTGHHTRGARTPARLPVAVQHYLLEEEGLEYSEPQPGLLCVVVY